MMVMIMMTRRKIGWDREGRQGNPCSGLNAKAEENEEDEHWIKVYKKNVIKKWKRAASLSSVADA